MELIIWVLLCAGVAYYADRKGRSPVAWGLGAVIFSPILVGLILALVKDLSGEKKIVELSLEQQQLRDRITVNEITTSRQLQDMDRKVDSLGGRVDKLDGGAPPVLPDAPEMRRLDTGAEENVPPAAGTEVAYCPHCGMKVVSGGKFCAHCGQILPESPRQSGGEGTDRA